MNPSLLSACGVLYTDHIAITTPDLAGTLAEFLSLEGYRLVKGPQFNPEQNVEYAFVQKPGETTIELLSGTEGSPVYRHIKQGSGPYHFCYAVGDLAASIAKAQAQGAAMVSPPTPDIAFDGRKVAFLFHKLHGVFEFVEAYPAAIPYSRSGAASSVRSVPASAVSAASRTQAAQGAQSGKSARLAGVFAAVFPKLDPAAIPGAALDRTEDWDSLAHIQLMMEIESEFETRFTPAQIQKAATFAAILELL